MIENDETVTLPNQPGEVPDPTLGLTDEEAGFPHYEPDPDDVALGDAEELEGDGDDIDEVEA